MTALFISQPFLGLLVSSLLRGGNCSSVVQNGACLQFFIRLGTPRSPPARFNLSRWQHMLIFTGATCSIVSRTAFLCFALMFRKQVNANRCSGRCLACWGTPEDEGSRSKAGNSLLTITCRWTPTFNCAAFGVDRVDSCQLTRLKAAHI